MIAAAEPSSPFKNSSEKPKRAKARPAAIPAPVVLDSPESPQGSLQKIEIKIRALLSSVADLVFFIKKDGVITEVHLPKGAPLAVDNFLGKRVMELLPIQIGQQAMHYLEKALRTGQTQVFGSPYVIGDQMRDFEARITPSGPAEAVAVVREVTARKLSEKEILEISNREQVRIGQDLHDGLGQHLTGVTFLTRALENKLAARSLPEAAEAAEIGRLVLQALSQTRNLARGLFPVELESNDLAPALRELAATVEKLFNISCTIEGDSDVAISNRTVVNHLFRLAQEAINNSVKHGKAKRVVIGLHTVADKAVLTIRDNGVGLTTGPAQSKGLGLRIMNYRAQRIGAVFEIRPAQGAGTVVTCSFPLT